MNKIHKYSIGILTTFIICITVCRADLIAEIQRTSRSQITSETAITFTWDRCAMKTSWTMSYNTWAWAVTMNNDYQYCFASWDTVTFNGSTRMNWGLLVDYRETWNECPTCPTCEEQYTSLECQTEYNLIPIESVTANYCHVNFWLIDAASCPINEWTGAINWSSLYINETQYSTNDTIRLWIPEFIAWNLTYNTWETIIDIEWYNADTEYIENVISQEKITPTNEDIEYFFKWLANYIPLIFVWFFIILVWRIIKKSFK